MLQLHSLGNLIMLISHFSLPPLSTQWHYTHSVNFYALYFYCLWLIMSFAATDVRIRTLAPEHTVSSHAIKIL